MRLSAESMANSDLWPGCDQAICDFVFCRGASPLLRGADDLLIACVAVSALLPVAAWFFPDHNADAAAPGLDGAAASAGGVRGVARAESAARG
jgi:hypothetical protein